MGSNWNDKKHLSIVWALIVVINMSFICMGPDPYDNEFVFVWALLLMIIMSWCLYGPQSLR